MSTSTLYWILSDDWLTGAVVSGSLIRLIILQQVHVVRAAGHQAASAAAVLCIFVISWGRQTCFQKACCCCCPIIFVSLRMGFRFCLISILFHFLSRFKKRLEIYLAVICRYDVTWLYSKEVSLFTTEGENIVNSVESGVLFKPQNARYSYESHRNVS